MRPEVPEAGPAQRQRRPFLRLLQGVTLAAVAGMLVLLIWRVVEVGRGSRLVSEIRDQRRPAAPAFRLPIIWPRSETWPAGLRSPITGGRLRSSQLRGRPVVLNFWASWCIPCRHEAPRLVASARAHAGEVVFLGVDVEDLTSDARSFLRRYRVNYVSVRDGGGSTYDDYGLTGVPETYWLDGRGRIVDHYPGEVSRWRLELGIREARRSR
jgi:cytochrome c biogenesis protein CcmG, thiol:disulfide interchange protein DsbE